MRKRQLAQRPSSMPKARSRGAQRRTAAMADGILYRLLLESIVDYAIFMLDPTGKVVSWNTGAERLKGFKEADIVGHSFSAFYTQEDRAAGLPQANLAAATDTGSYQGTGWRVRKDGSTFWAHVTVTPVLSDAGSLIGFAKVIRDLTASKRRDDEVRIMRGQLDLALGNMSHGLALFDSQARLLLWNARWLELIGSDERSVRPGTSYVEIARGVLSRAGVPAALLDKRAADECDALVASLKQAAGATVVEERLTGTASHVHSHRATPDGGWVSTVADVTERRRIEERLTFLMRHDALTGLPHRTATWTPPIDVHGGSAVLYVDLRRFKAVIAARGHAAGDRVLQVVAGRIGERLRQRDVAIRLGGDEFLVVAPTCVGEENARSLAERLAAAIEAPIAIEGGVVSVKINVGISLSPRDGTDYGTLLDKAHLALQAQQETGLPGATLYDPGMETSKRDRSILEQELHAALSKNEFELAFQPIVEADGFALTGFEALLRWTSPTRGPVPPAEFVPIAEEIGLMCDVDEWVLHAACTQALKWDRHLAVCVNLSATQLSKPGLGGRIAAILRVTGLAAERLEVEITETAYIDNLALATSVIGDVRALGVRVALDDFGTGFSSLSLLRTLPFTRIKIDRSFTRDILTSPQSSAIVQAICGLCGDLGVQSTAEGVETADVAHRLRAKRCTNLQGYFFGGPIAAGSVEAWIQSRRSDTLAHRSDPGRDPIRVRAIGLAGDVPHGRSHHRPGCQIDPVRDD